MYSERDFQEYIRRAVKPFALALAILCTSCLSIELDPQQEYATLISELRSSESIESKETLLMSLSTHLYGMRSQNIPINVSNNELELVASFLWNHETSNSAHWALREFGSDAAPLADQFYDAINEYVEAQLSHILYQLSEENRDRYQSLGPQHYVYTYMCDLIVVATGEFDPTRVREHVRCEHGELMVRYRFFPEIVEIMSERGVASPQTQ